MATWPERKTKRLLPCFDFTSFSSAFSAFLKLALSFLHLLTHHSSLFPLPSTPSHLITFSPAFHFLSSHKHFSFLVFHLVASSSSLYLLCYTSLSYSCSCYTKPRESQGVIFLNMHFIFISLNFPCCSSSSLALHLFPLLLSSPRAEMAKKTAGGCDEI